VQFITRLANSAITTNTFARWRVSRLLNVRFIP